MIPADLPECCPAWKGLNQHRCCEPQSSSVQLGLALAGRPRRIPNSAGQEGPGRRVRPLGRLLPCFQTCSTNVERVWRTRCRADLSATSGSALTGRAGAPSGWKRSAPRWPRLADSAWTLLERLEAIHLLPCRTPQALRLPAQGWPEQRESLAEIGPIADVRGRPYLPAHADPES